MTTETQWEDTRRIVSEAWETPARRAEPEVVDAVERVLAALDAGRLRVAEKANGEWRVNEWVKEAILLYFVHRQITVTEHAPFEYRDKIPLKTGFDRNRTRVVPPATVRYGAFLEPDVVVMPSYVNLGAYVGSGTMVDTWATVGSCAQIGRGVHLSGGVGIGGVLEPVQAAPVIVEDGAFIGSRCIVVEGVRVEEEAVLAAGVVLTASTPIIDVTGPEPVEHRGRVPARSVVLPGTRSKEFPAGTYGVPVALIIGSRRESTDRKTSLNDVLREFGIPT
jgi:2,3,4,5-tetrahydropyridine-2-carboxylate N-succinyltransferase